MNLGKKVRPILRGGGVELRWLLATLVTIAVVVLIIVATLSSSVQAVSDVEFNELFHSSD